jgi:MFS family permease
MKWEVKDALTEEDLNRGLRGVTWDGLATKMSVTLASGAFLVAFALQLGASNSVIGLLAALPFLAQMLQLPSVYLVEKVRVRRAISIYAMFVSRSTLLIVGLIPFFIPRDWQIEALITALVLKGAFSAISQCAWSSWMRDLVPREKRGTFYAKRMSLAAGLGMILALCAGVYLDRFKISLPEYVVYSYSALFLVAFVAGMANVWVVSRIPEPRMQTKKVSILKLMLEPFRDENFRNLMKFLVAWNFGINLAAPFFTVYMLRKIHLDMTAVVLLTVISQIANITVIRIWGRFMDQFSNKTVLRVCGPLYALCIFLWIFTLHPGPHSLTMPLLVLLHVLMGVATAGTVLGTSNIAIRLAPRDAASSYLATSSLANSVAAGLAPILGGQFADFFEERRLTLILKWSSPISEATFQTFKLHHWDFFFVFAFLIALISIWQLGRVQEEGEVRRRVVLQEFLYEISRNFRSMSTVGGLLQVPRFPIFFGRNNGLNGKNGHNGSGSHGS